VRQGPLSGLLKMDLLDGAAAVHLNGEAGGALCHQAQGYCRLAPAASN